MTDRQRTHGHDCWGWGAKHYECAVREIERLAARLTAETSTARGEVEYEYEVWQGDALQAGGREANYASAQSEANHYAMMYAPDGPVEVRIYEKRLLSTTQQYGVSPECDAQPPADDALLRQALEVLSRARQTAMMQTLKARIPECAEFGGIAQDLDFVVASLRERLGGTAGEVE